MCLLIFSNIITQINDENIFTFCLICQLILDMFIDKENIESETSVEIDQQVNEESSENTMQGILTFENTHAHFPLQSISILTYLLRLIHGEC